MKKKSVKIPQKSMSVTSSKSVFYDNDFVKWADKQALLLKNRDFSHLDIENLIEEIEALSKRDRRALKKQLIRLMMHLLKLDYQKRDTPPTSWMRSISGARTEIILIIDDSPSLQREVKDMIDAYYSYAVSQASKETGMEKKVFPKICPWTIKKLLSDRE